MNVSKRIPIFAMFAISSIIVSCSLPLGHLLPSTVDSGDSGNGQRRLIYDGNGNTGGIVPSAAAVSAAVHAIIVQGNIGGLTKNGKPFVKWNTHTDGSGEDYESGDYISLDGGDKTLYAQFGGDPSDGIPGLPPYMSGVPDVESLITGNRYYVDPASGNDSSGSGSSTSPWKTLAKARSAAQGGDGIYLRSGNYGAFTETSGGRGAYLVIRGEEGATPVFTTINLDYSGRNGDSYLAFYGLKVAPPWVAPGGNPQDPNSTQTTYAKTLNAVEIRGANHVMVIGCELAGQRKYLTELAVWVRDSSQVKVAGCDMRDVHRAVSYDGSTFLSFIGNHIHRIAGSAFKGSDGTSTDILIEGNHAHDSNYDYADDYCPRAPGANYHGSAVAIRGDRMTIRNNVFHDGFNSAGIMTYDADSADADLDYSDILIENNLLYDIRNYYTLRFYLIDSDIVVRNNTFVGHRRTDGAAYYDTTVIINSLASGATAAALTLDNNIVVGTVSLSASQWADVNQHNNIIYSCLVNGEWKYLTQAQVGGGTRVATAVDTTSYLFESGFFAGPVRFDYDNSDSSNPLGHHQTLDFSLASGSPAIGFGDPARQPADGLGAIDANGFIQVNPTARTASRHSAGAYP